MPLLRPLFGSEQASAHLRSGRERRPRSGGGRLTLAGSVTAKLILKASAAGPAAIAWRIDRDQDILPAKPRRFFQTTASDDWQTPEVQLPARGRIIHPPHPTPGGIAQLRDPEFKPAGDPGWNDTLLSSTTKFDQKPNFERLAKRGMTSTRAYSASPR